MARQSPIINELYDEYVTLRYAGFSYEQALQHFESYLHPITLARLKKRIREEAPQLEGTYLGLVDAPRLKAEAEAEITQPCIVIPFKPKVAEPSLALDNKEEDSNYRKSS